MAERRLHGPIGIVVTCWEFGAEIVQIQKRPNKPLSNSRLAPAHAEKGNCARLARIITAEQVRTKARFVGFQALPAAAVACQPSPHVLHRAVHQGAGFDACLCEPNLIHLQVESGMALSCKALHLFRERITWARIGCRRGWRKACLRGAAGVVGNQAAAHRELPQNTVVLATQSAGVRACNHADAARVPHKKRLDEQVVEKRILHVHPVCRTTEWLHLNCDGIAEEQRQHWNSCMPPHTM